MAGLAGAFMGGGGVLLALTAAKTAVELLTSAWEADGKAAVLLDLADPRSFPAALAGIDRVFVLTAYTIEMVHQVKCITDAAADAGADHDLGGGDQHAAYLGLGLNDGDQYIGIEPGADEKNFTPGTTITQTQSAVVLENLIGQFLFNKAADAGSGDGGAKK